MIMQYSQVDPKRETINVETSVVNLLAFFFHKFTNE